MPYYGSEALDDLLFTYRLFVFLPVLAHILHDVLVFGVAAEADEVLVALEPRVVVISERYRFLQPENCLVSFAQQGVDAAQPIGDITVDDLLWLVLEDDGGDPGALAAGGVEESGQELRDIVASVASQFQGTDKNFVGFVELVLVVEELAEISQDFELVRVGGEGGPHLLLGPGGASLEQEHAGVHPVDAHGGGIQRDAAVVSLFSQIEQA